MTIMGFFGKLTKKIENTITRKGTDNTDNTKYKPDESNPFASHPVSGSGGRSSYSNVNSNNNRSNITAINHGKSWSDDEERQLRRRYDGGSSIDDLSKMHGRTREAIVYRLKKFGYRV